MSYSPNRTDKESRGTYEVQVNGETVGQYVTWEATHGRFIREIKRASLGEYRAEIEIVHCVIGCRNVIQREVKDDG